MITFNKESRKKFVEEFVQEILTEIEAPLRAKIEQMATATELATKLAIKVAEQEAAEKDKATDEFEDGPDCDTCPLSGTCPGSSKDDEDEKESIQDILKAIFGREPDTEEAEGSAEEEEAEDEGEDEDGGVPTVDITTKNLTPEQTALVEKFLKDLENLGKKGREKAKGKTADK